MCMPLDAHACACAGPFRCVRRTHVCVDFLTCVHVHVLAVFGMYTLFMCVYAFGRASTCQFRPFSVCTQCLCVCTPLDVHPCAVSSPFRCVRPVHVCMHLWTCIHVPEPALSCVNTLCTWVYASGRASTCLHWPFSVCTSCARVCTPVDVHPRTGTGRVGWVHPLEGCVSLSTCIHVPVPAYFGAYALCTCVDASGRACTCLYRPF